LIAAGLENRAIAGRLHIETSTVKSHLNRIFAKTGAADRADVIRYARRHGLTT
jgi:DNA-binding NarL/FixJ family response regulator